jgi:hypothetical protein
LTRKVTPAETEKILDWLAKDAQAKAVIDRKVSSIVASQLDENLTAWEQWKILSQQYSWNDLLSQYELRARVHSEKLKDAEDAVRYLGIFEDARRCFIQMGITYSDDEVVFDLLQGLPDIIEWQIFRELAMTKLNTSSSSTMSSTSTCFSDVAKSFAEKANAIVGKRRLAGPGSEYANAVTSPVSNFAPARINSATGLKMHRNNPKGIKCANTSCAHLPRVDNHDHDHCYWPGGGMEDKAPAWIRSRSKLRTETAAAAITYTPTTEIANSAMEPKHRRELSCTSIDKLSTSHIPRFAALLDSGTTSHIIIDRSHFIDFTPEDHPPVKTANQGELVTLGWGTCVADITIGGVEHRITLRDCLYAPKAVFNLISVGRMLQWGWDCVFKGSLLSLGPYCEFSHKGRCLGQVPMVGNLCQLDMHFVPQARLSTAPVAMEITAFIEQPLTWDTWHARLGHPGGDSVKCLPIIVTGVKVGKDTLLQRCEACVMAKHPCRPFPSSETPRADHILDLIHSDVCGPFPVQMPHGKVYFIMFLDNHMHLINIQLLTSKDQALQAWTIVKNLWENHAKRWVKFFRSDNGGEYISGAFTKALQDTGIKRQLTLLYAHQQNGKAEWAIHTIQGRSHAMLEAVGLPQHLWGEVVLTAGYLWNHTESRSLPPGKTPYEMVNGKQPDLSHLRIFGSHCWARIPAELQTKFGLHFRRTIFMGYPEGVKGYRVRDAATGTFFTARDIIFDEGSSPPADSESDDDDENSIDTVPDPMSLTSTSSTPSTPVPPPSTDQPRRFGRIRLQTEKGRMYTADIAAAKARLERGNTIKGVDEVPSMGVEDAESTSLGNIEPNGDIPEVVVNIIIEKQAHLAIRSDKHHDPYAVDYDLKIPPATYEEAMHRPNCYRPTLIFPDFSLFFLTF